MFFPISSVVIISTENIIFLPFILFILQFSSVQSLSRLWLFANPWITARQASLSITNSWSLLKLMPIESVMPSSHLILCRPLLLLPPIPPSIRVFSNESTLHMRWPKYWSFSFSISPSSEHPGLISFRMDWFDLLAVQGTLKSLLNTTVQKHQFFGAQLSSQSNSHIHMWPLEFSCLLCSHVLCLLQFWVICCCSFAELRPRGLQHARLPCPSPSPGVCSNSGPLSQWRHPTISSLILRVSQTCLLAKTFSRLPCGKSYHVIPETRPASLISGPALLVLISLVRPFPRTSACSLTLCLRFLLFLRLRFMLLKLRFWGPAASVSPGSLLEKGIQPAPRSQVIRIHSLGRQT